MAGLQEKAPQRAPGGQRYNITDSAIAAWLAQGVERNRIFYDAHRDAPRGFGLRITPKGVASFVLNYYAGGAERRATVGRYGKAPHGLSITAARKEAAKLRDSVNAGGDPVRVKRAKVEATKAAKAEAQRKKDYGLGALLAAYVEHQKAEGRADWRKVEGAIARHITKPFPKLAAKPADEVTLDDVMPAVSALTEAGKFTEARKLRAYLRAAYTAARRARHDAALHRFVGFRIQFNPLEDLRIRAPKQAAGVGIEGMREEAQRAHSARAARVWALSEAELAAYWKRITAPDAPHGALLRFHLLTGGQRIEQLARLIGADHDADLQTVTLYDTKGRRSEAHVHVVPLIPGAADALAEMRGDEGPHLFTVSRGRNAAVYHTVREAVRTVAQAMLEAGEVERLFTPGTIRKTVETRLAAKGVADEVLSRLLSHGLGNVQSRHYNAHHYDDEKRAALVKLRAVCEPKGKPGNVTPMRRQERHA